MNYRKEINKMISELGITRRKTAEIMGMSYDYYKQKSSEKRPEKFTEKNYTDLLVYYQKVINFV